MKHCLKALGIVLAACGAGNVSADIIDFTFTGRLTVFGASSRCTTTTLCDISNFSVINGGDTTFDPYGYQTPIAANLSIDTAGGTGFSDLAFTFSFLGEAVTIHDINLAFQSGNLVAGSMLGDWNGTVDNPLSILWDATGLFNAIDLGLQVGDRISGTNLYRDTDGDGVAETFIADVMSATPWSDGWTNGNSGPSYYSLNQGPAPIATTPGIFGITDGPFAGVQVHLDIGSGNSLHVAAIQAVPVPAAVWLFGTGLVSLMGLARRKTA